MKFKPITRERFDEMLSILPPAYHSLKGFLVGEPWRHSDKGEPMFAPFLSLPGNGIDIRATYYEGDEPITIADFRALDARTSIQHNMAWLKP